MTMTDVLLIQPPIEDFYLTAKRTVPYGLACLAGALRAGGLEVKILDGLASSRARVLPWPAEMEPLRPHYGREDRTPFALFHRYRRFGLDVEQIGRAAAAEGARLVGIASLFTAYSEVALRTAEAVKRHDPACAVVLGGHHATALPGQVMTHPAVDFVIRGEGELALAGLARALREGTEPAGIPGLVRRRPGGQLEIPAPCHVDHLDHLPPPATDLIEQRHYRHGDRVRAVVVTSRGCPLRCSYCAVGAGSGLPYRRRSVASVLAEIERQIGPHAAFIDFEDENLALERGWLAELMVELAKRSQDLELRAMNGLLPHTLDRELVGLMKRAGFRTLNLSLGSSDADQLHRFRRPDERRAFDEALATAEELGLDAVGYVIAAAPGQDPRRSVDDLLFLARRRVLPALSIYYPAPGSEDFSRCAVAGLLPPSPTLYRSTALPVEDRTTREQAVTLLRLARILGFLKGELDAGRGLPPPAPPQGSLVALDRVALGRSLVGAFLHDGRIRGLTPAGELYVHPACDELCRAFVEGLGRIEVRGSRR